MYHLTHFHQQNNQLITHHFISDIILFDPFPMPPYQFIDNQLQQWQLNDSLMLKNRKLLDKIHQQSRKKSITYLNSQQNRKSRPQSSPSPSIDIKPSVNQLRQMATQQKLQTSKIQNRLKYLHVSSQRQQKLVNTAKQKFYKISEVRRQSVTQKSFLSKQRKNLLMQHQKTVHLKASAIKSQRIRTTQSQQKAFKQKKSKAHQVKKQRSLNQSLIRDQNQHQKSLKSQKVIRVQQYQQLQRQKSSLRAKQKIQQGITNHKNVILKQYQQVQRQMKMRKSMMKSFEEKVTKIYDKRQKQQKQLEQYRVYLGLSKSQITKSQVNSNEKTANKPPLVIDDTMLFKSRHKKVITPHSSKQTHSSSHYNSARTKGKTQMGFYLTNPEYYH